MSNKSDANPPTRTEFVSGSGTELRLSEELARIAELEQSDLLWPGHQKADVCCRLVDTILKTRWHYPNIQLSFSGQTVEWLLAKADKGEGWPDWAIGAPRLLCAGILVRKDLNSLWRDDRSSLNVLHYAWFFILLSLEFKPLFGHETVDSYISVMEDADSEFVPSWFPYGLVTYCSWEWRADLGPVTPDNLNQFELWWIRGGALELGFPLREVVLDHLNTIDDGPLGKEWYFTRAMRNIFDERCTSIPQACSNPTEIMRFLAWWLLGGARENGMEISPLVRENLNRPSRESALEALGFTEGMLAIYHYREDISSRFPLDHRLGQRQFIGWWLLGGARENGMEISSLMRENLNNPASESELAEFGFTEAMLAVYYYRQDISSQFSLSDPLGRLKFIGWWLAFGCVEAGFNETEELERLQSFPMLGEARHYGVSVALMALSTAGFEGFDGDLPRDALGYRTLIGRWLTARKRDQAGLMLSRWQHIKLGLLDPDADPALSLPLLATALAASTLDPQILEKALAGDQDAGRAILAVVALDPSWGEIGKMARVAYVDLLTKPSHEFGPHIPITTSTVLRRLYDEALVSLPHVDAEEAKNALVGWQMRHEWRHQYDIPKWCIPLLEKPQEDVFDLPFGLVALAAFERSRFLGSPFDDFDDAHGWLKSLGAREPARFSWMRMNAKARVNGLPPWPGFANGGVQILGWAKGELGVGEDVRMGSRALTAANVPHIPINVSRGTLSGREQDNTLEDLLGRESAYACNITFLATPDHYRFRLQSVEGVRDGRYNIGNWVWELPVWPSRLDFVFDAVDEVWAPSDFVKNAFSGRDVPVIWMPPCVEIAAPDPLNRGDFNLLQGDFVFLTTFDVNSSISRKNPQGVIKAFQQAFPSHFKDVRLIVKTMNGEKDPLKWQSVIKLGNMDSRILFINETLPRQKSLALLSMADCFVSMHRAEGFGRNIAEAMLLEKVVLSSAFSGNMDFTFEDNCYLIQGELRPLEENEYTYWTGQQWFEPSVTDAAEKMQLVYENRGESQERGRKGRNTIRNLYSAEAVGQRYRQRLEELGFL